MGRAIAEDRRIAAAGLGAELDVAGWSDVMATVGGSFGAVVDLETKVAGVWGVHVADIGVPCPCTIPDNAEAIRANVKTYTTGEIYLIAEGDDGI